MNCIYSMYVCIYACMYIYVCSSRTSSCGGNIEYNNSSTSWSSMLIICVCMKVYMCRTCCTNMAAR